MGIKTKNMIIGGVTEPPPTPPKKEEPKKVNSFKELVSSLTAKSEQPVKKEIVKEIKPEVKPVVDYPKYIKKQDGELIRHINRKSHYLNDMIEIDSEINK